MEDGVSVRQVNCPALRRWGAHEPEFQTMLRSERKVCAGGPETFQLGVCSLLLLSQKLLMVLEQILFPAVHF